MLLTDPRSQSHLGISCSLSLADLFGCVCVPHRNPLALFDSTEVKDLIHFSPVCQAFSPLGPVSHSFRVFFFLTINL